MSRAASTTEASICPAAAAGRYYPAAAERLTSLVQQCLAGAVAPAGAGPLTALIVPHAGYAYSGRTAGRAYACVTGNAIRRAVVLAPCHSAACRGLNVGRFQAFRTPLGDMPLDTDVCRALRAAQRDIAAGDRAFRDEHAIEVQLPFLQTVCPAARLVPVLCGDLSPAQIDSLAECLATVVPQEGTLWVVSSDFTHYGAAFGYVPFAEDVLDRVEQLDRGAIEVILQGNVKGWREYVRSTGATICGATAIDLLLALRQRLGPAWSAKLLDYTQSGRLQHDDSRSVGYAAIAFFAAAAAAAPSPWQLSVPAQRTLLRLAREALTAEVGGQPHPLTAVESLPASLTGPGASFVSLHRGGALRGCMGSLEARQPLYQDVMENALNAAFRDPRFAPVRADELRHLRLEVSVLGPLQPMANHAGFDLGRHGIRLRRGCHSAVYLPQVPLEQGWDRQTTLEQLCRKAGLSPGAWRQGAELHVFETCICRDEEP